MNMAITEISVAGMDYGLNRDNYDGAMFFYLLCAIIYGVSSRCCRLSACVFI